MSVNILTHANNLDLFCDGITFTGQSGAGNITSGTFTTTFTIVSGFSSGASNTAVIKWIRIGNIVNCSFWFDAPNPTVVAGIGNLATFTLPVARPNGVNFANNYDLTGTCNLATANQSSSLLTAKTSTTNVGQLTLWVAVAGAQTIEGTFSYTLV